MAKQYHDLTGIPLSYSDRCKHILTQYHMGTAPIPEYVYRALQKGQLDSTIASDVAARTNKQNSLALTWKQFENCLHKNKQSSFYLVGFGSLVNNAFNYQTSKPIPCIAYGVTRTYNMHHQNPAASPVGLPTPGYADESLRLTAKHSPCTSDMINGALVRFDLRSKAYKLLKEREASYQLIPLKVALYNNLLHHDVVIQHAYMLCTPINRHCAKSPHIIYNSIVMDGFKELEESGADAFVPLYLETTCLANEKTSLKKWLNQQAVLIKQPQRF